ncbi:hypothetical protein [Bradyrhizobium prioriisuperbiae]|uniref:hypothetical protein n=1 Tax=Bradyrhizobium prioriisuperbiae TaxID=2854389 RepID=UPI0028EBA807|nr:hypothetical protein [Bradyrhizobium prioritasuperba]
MGFGAPLFNGLRGSMSNQKATSAAREPALDVKRLALILDDAWERMVATCGEAEATSANRAALASRIVVLAQQGETDARQMSEAAAIYLSALIAVRGLQQRNSETSISCRATPLRENAGAAYDADALAAMEEGLALCREALPDPIPSVVSAFLLTSILDQAAKGERNPVQLCNRALEALRARR